VNSEIILYLGKKRTRYKLRVISREKLTQQNSRYFIENKTFFSPLPHKWNTACGWGLVWQTKPS
jgi:hypothetical protein